MKTTDRNKSELILLKLYYTVKVAFFNVALGILITESHAIRAKQPLTSPFT